MYQKDHNSTVSYIQNGDLFKLMKLRYPDSLYTTTGIINYDYPPSICIELIEWFEQCESFIRLLVDTLSTIDSLEQFDTFVRNNSTYLDLKDNRVKPDSRFSIPIAYEKMNCDLREIFSSRYKLTEDEDIAKLLNEWKISNKIQKYKLIESFLNGIKHYCLTPQFEDLCDELIEYLKTSSQYHVLCLDITIKQSLENIKAYAGWDEQAFCYRNILQKALQYILNGTNTCQRFYVKTEVINRFDFRFHLLMILDPLVISEGEWIQNLEIALRQIFNNQNQLKQWQDELEIQFNSKLRDLFDEYVNYLPKELAKQKAWSLWKPEYFSLDVPIDFELLNWNDQLRRLIPDLSCTISPANPKRDLSQLEYWIIKYAFWSRNLIALSTTEFKLQDLVRVVFEKKQSDGKTTDKVEKESGLKSIQVNQISKNIVRRQGAGALSLKTTTGNNSVITNLVVKEITQSSSSNTQEIDKSKISKRRTYDPIQEKLSKVVIGLKKESVPSSALKQKLPKYIKIKEISFIQKPLEYERIQLSTFNDLIEAAKKDKSIWTIDYKRNNEMTKIIEYAKVFYKEEFHGYDHLSNFLFQLKFFLLALKETNYSAFILLNQGDLDLKSPVDITNMTVLGKQYLSLYDEFVNSKMKDKDLLHKVGSKYLKFIQEIFSFDIQVNIPVKEIPIFSQQALDFNKLAMDIRLKLINMENEFRDYKIFLKYLEPACLEKIFQKKRIVIRLNLKNDVYFMSRVGNELGFLGKAFAELTKRIESKTKGRLSRDIEYIKVAKYKFIGQQQRVFFDVLFMIEPQDNFSEVQQLIEEIRNQWDSALKVVYSSIQGSENVGPIQANAIAEQQLMHSVNYLQKLSVFVENHNEDKVALLDALKSSLIPYFISHAICLPWEKKSNDNNRQITASSGFTRKVTKPIARKNK